MLQLDPDFWQCGEIDLREKSEPMFPADVEGLAAQVLKAASERGLQLVTAESCTGGLVAAALTEIPGSSAVVDRGFVTYSNAAKAAVLGVPAALIEEFGAVSAEVALAMAEGALTVPDAGAAVSVTGVAGPGGGSADKPVGLVHFGCAVRGQAPRSRVEQFGDIGRSAVRSASVRAALELLLDSLQAEAAGAP